MSSSDCGTTKGDQLGSLPPGTLCLCCSTEYPYWPARVMGFQEARRQENLDKSTIVRIRNGLEKASCVMFFGDKCVYINSWLLLPMLNLRLWWRRVMQMLFFWGSNRYSIYMTCLLASFFSTVSIQPVERIEPHVAVGRGVGDTLFRDWVWKASTEDRKASRKSQFGKIIRERFERAFDVSREWAEEQIRTSRFRKSHQSLVVLSGACDEGAPEKNGLLPAGSLLWCSLSQDPAWPCRVVSLRDSVYQGLRREALGKGQHDSTEPVVFFGDDDLKEPQKPMLASLSELSVFLLGNAWVPHFRLRSIRLAEIAEPPVDTSDWNGSLWAKWEVATEMARECASELSVSALYRWLALPGSGPDATYLDPVFGISAAERAKLRRSARPKLQKRSLKIGEPGGVGKLIELAPGFDVDDSRSSDDEPGNAGEDEDTSLSERVRFEIGNGETSLFLHGPGVPLTDTQPATSKKRRKKRLDWSSARKKQKLDVGTDFVSPADRRIIGFPDRVPKQATRRSARANRTRENGEPMDREQLRKLARRPTGGGRTANACSKNEDCLVEDMSALAEPEKGSGDDIVERPPLGFSQQDDLPPRNVPSRAKKASQTKRVAKSESKTDVQEAKAEKAIQLQAGNLDRRERSKAAEDDSDDDEVEFIGRVSILELGSNGIVDPYDELGV